MNKLINLITIFTFIFFGGFVYSQTNCESARKKYLELNPDVAKAGMDAWNHYTVFGKNEGRVWPQCASEVSNVNAGNNTNSKIYPSCFYNNGNLSIFQLGNYEILFSNQEMTWYEVNDLCKKLGDDWYLPSRVAVIILVEKLNFGNINKLWTSDENTSMPNGNYSGKTWTNADYDVAEALEFKSRETVSLYKSDKATFAIARCKGNNFEKVKSNLSSAYNVGDIKVSTNEIANVTYLEAKNLCAQLGEGWRLPTIEELESIKKNGRNCEIDISVCFYWSKTSSCDGCTDSYYSLSLNSGKRNLFDKFSKLRVIPVYSAPKEKLKTWNFGSYEICTSVYGPMNLSEAKSFCSKLSDEPNKPWRIANMQELSSMKAYKKDIPSMIGKTFMSYTPGKDRDDPRQDLEIVDIAPIGQEESYWIRGSENGSYYFFISR